MNGAAHYTEILTNPGTVPLADIPVLPYDDFCDFADLLMREEGTHCLTYFVLPEPGHFRFICSMGADENHAVVLFSHIQPVDPLPVLPSLTARHYQFHGFEREIHEKFGIGFSGHPWLKPIRWPHDRAGIVPDMKDYPFWKCTGEELHEVGVGPIHAGIIEPGHFRFTCSGELVHHLEIHLGYQHRGVESLFCSLPALLQQAVLSESIAGDTAIGHALAYAGIAESLGEISVPDELQLQRAVALELERMAMHIGDTAALCNDVAYQLGQVVCEALRTIVINTTQLWCGNRFGKGLIRPGGSYYPLSASVANAIIINLEDVISRYDQMTERIFSLPSVLGRFEGTGKITTMQASLAGAVGIAARSAGMYRDIRWSHPYGAYRHFTSEPVILPGGDVHARALLRQMEADSSFRLIKTMLGSRNPNETITEPLSRTTFQPSSLAISMTEGWRGEICHAAVTDEEGRLKLYKVKDPSFHNWLALALAVRHQEISDFPLCNKSFNLSYCGNDL